MHNKKKGKIEYVFENSQIKKDRDFQILWWQI